MQGMAPSPCKLSSRKPGSLCSPTSIESGSIHVNQSFYLILVLGLLTTALSGCGLWPHATAGVAVPAHVPPKDNVSFAGRPADEAPPSV